MTTPANSSTREEDASPMLSAAQLAAVHHPPTPLLIVAGAGSGKTTVMAARIAELARSGVEAHRILGLTFSNKAAANLRARVNQTRHPTGDVHVTTYHGFGASLINEHRDLLARTRSGPLRLLDRAQAWQVLFDVFDDFSFERRKVGKPSIIVRDALALASRCADHLVDIETVAADCQRIMDRPLPVAKSRGGRASQPSKVQEAAAKRLELCQVVAEYERRKAELGLLDHGDQIALAVRLMSEHPQLAAEKHDEHPYVLLDEYQDTNYAQRRLLQLLYPEGSAICAVGDDMQSIYAFRGAHLGNILRFEEHFPPAAEARLEVNYRSGPQLVALANRIQAQVNAARPKVLVADEHAEPTVIECFLASDDRDEAQTIAEEIIAAGPPWRNYAVLCRKRKMIAAIVEALGERGAPVEVVGLGGLLVRPEVVDVIAWLELLAGINTVVPALRVLQGPRYRLGFRDLAALARHARSLRPEGSHARIDLRLSLDQLDQVTNLSPEAWQRGKQLAAEIAELQAVSDRVALADLVDAVIARTQLWSDVDERGRENLLRLIDLAARFRPVDAASPTVGLHAFLEYLQLITESEDDLSEAVSTGIDAVQVMTVHQAKGLEFPVVFVPGLAGGEKARSKMFPDERAAENGATQSDVLPLWLRTDNEGVTAEPASAAAETAHAERARKARLDEEWRLFYVAVTRAQRRLVCSAAHWYPGPAAPQGPSRFYDFIAAQGDLATERFRRPPAVEDPEIAAMQRRAQALAGAAALEDAAHAHAGTVAARSLRGAPSSRRRLSPGQNALLPVEAGRAAHQPLAPAVPTTLSVTSVVSYARCPKQFYWSVLKPLPRSDSAAARLGTRVHQWIEARADRQLALFETDTDLDQTDPDQTDAHQPEAGQREANDRAARNTASLSPDPPGAAQQRAFLATPFAALTPVRVEIPLSVSLVGRTVRGRIDAVYQRDDRIELVDWKTGRKPYEGEGSASTQLDIYGLAAIAMWGAAPEQLRTTYCYLGRDGSPEIHAVDWDDGRHEEVNVALDKLLTNMSNGRFDACPGQWCTGCDFRTWCPAAPRGSDTPHGTVAPQVP